MIEEQEQECTPSLAAIACGTKDHQHDVLEHSNRLENGDISRTVPPAKAKSRLRPSSATPTIPASASTFVAARPRKEMTRSHMPRKTS